MKLLIEEVVCLVNKLDDDIRLLLDSSLPNKQQHRAAVAIVTEKFNALRDKLSYTQPHGIVIREAEDGVNANLSTEQTF